jgi:hypothetical protein
MNTRRCLKIANRIDTLLQDLLNQGIDAERMVADALYARDVLLVCEAFGSGELPQLAQLYRAAASAPPGEPNSQSAGGPTPPQAQPGRAAHEPERTAGRTSGLTSGLTSGRISGFFSSIFAPSTLPPPLEPPPAAEPQATARRNRAPPSAT